MEKYCAAASQSGEKAQKGEVRVLGLSHDSTEGGMKTDGVE